MRAAVWSFHNPTRLHFGMGSRERLAALLAGKRVLVVSTRRGRKQMMSDTSVANALPDHVIWVDSVLPNPGLADLQIEIDCLTGQVFDIVLAFGGGSVIDAAKALSVALAADVPSSDLRFLIDNPQQWKDLAAVPLVAVTTTSGTGSEVTPFATIWDHEAHRKLSLSGPPVSPHTAIVDPELTYDLPLDLTAPTGLDALNQACESVWNRNASPVTLSIAGRAIGLALSALQNLHSDISDCEARNQMAEASLLAGLCISQTRTAICHSISYPITARFGVPHGYACAFTMIAVAERAVDFAPDRFDKVAKIAGLDGRASLLLSLRSLLDTYGVAEIVRATLNDVNAVTMLQSEMVAPERAGNYIMPLMPGDLDRILLESFSA